MLRSILERLVSRKYPPFRNLYMQQLPAQLLNQYHNPIFWTPRYQKIPYSSELTKYLRYLQRKKTIKQSDFKQMIQNILTQYAIVSGRDILMQKNIQIPKSSLCEYHGQVDWLYSLSGKNYTPIMFNNLKLNPAAGIAMALSNLYIRLSQSQEGLDKKGQCFGYSLITTGQQWQIIRIDRYMKLEKSIIIEGNNKFRNLYEDQQMVSVVMGMLDICLQSPFHNVEALEKAYQYLDERKFMVQAESEEEAKKTSFVSKLLLEYYKRKY